MGGHGRRRRVGAVAVALALAAGCSDDGSSRAEPTVPRRTTTTDAFAVPDPIDVAYVERVMAELDRLYGDAAREVARERALTPRFEDLMRAIYADDEEFALALELWKTEEREGFSHLAQDPGNPRTRIEELRRAAPDCIIATVDRDFSEVASATTSQERQLFVVLVRAAASGGATNPTGWALSFEGFKADGSEPGEEECAAG